MVKPPKSMQPEGILKDPESSANKKKNPHRGGMEGDTFRHYMSRKITLQRQQFGIENHLPPPAAAQLEIIESKGKVRFTGQEGMSGMLERLKRKHGHRRKRSRQQREQESSPSSSSVEASPLRAVRPDLFLRGVVVLVNGYTNPDNETLRRMLHAHGGDLETYETTRITHIIASRLSFAKAKIYKKQRKPIPVVKPDWIVDCVEQQRRLPHGPYLLNEVKEQGSVSVKAFFGASNSRKDVLPNKQETPSPVQQVVVVKKSPPKPSLPEESPACQQPSDDDLTQLDSPSSSLTPLGYVGLHTQLFQQESNTDDESPLQESSAASPPKRQKLSDTESKSLSDEKSMQSPLNHLTSKVCDQSPTLECSERQSGKQSHPSTNPIGDTTSNAANVADRSPASLQQRTPNQLATHQSLDRMFLDSPTTPCWSSAMPDTNDIDQQSSTSPSTVNSHTDADGIPSEPNRAVSSLSHQTPNHRENGYIHKSPELMVLDTPTTPSATRSWPNAADLRQATSADKTAADPCRTGQDQLTEQQQQQQQQQLQLQLQQQDRAITTEQSSTLTTTKQVHSTLNAKTDSKYINGKLRTTGTDPDFLESFFNNSRLSFIGSFKQRARTSPLKQKRSLQGSDSSCKRLVFHCDMDCFFAMVVLRNFPEHKNKPVAISHHGNKNGRQERASKTSSSECATCNYEARKYGIKKGMFLGQARELCPNLVVLQYDFEGYEEVSEQVADILYRYATEYQGAVEQVSCDEAYMELYLSGDGEYGVNEQAKDIGERIRDEIVQATDCTATIGIGANKLLAKLGTDKVKPDGCHVVKDFKDLLEPLKLRELHGVGYRSERKLTEEGLVTIKDVWDLGEHAETTLCRILGNATGKKILCFCKGQDDREVKPAERKTIGAECNYGVRIDGPYGVDYLIEGLAKEVEKRMLGVGVAGTKLTLKVKQRKAGAKPPPKFLGHGSCHNMSRSQELSYATRDAQVLGRAGLQLFQELGVPLGDVRGMGMVVSKLSTGKPQAESTAGIKTWFQPKLCTTSSALETDTETEGCEDQNEVMVASAQPNHTEQQPFFEVLPDRENVLSTPPAPPAAVDDDFELPPPSQIRLSQVEALPSPLKLRIMTRLEQSHLNNDDEDDSTFDVANDEGVPAQPLKQTNVKQLFRLAAVKAGRENLAGSLGEGVSLTQLDCLPLEMQLQIANNGQIASPSKRTSRHRPLRRSKSSFTVATSSHHGDAAAEPEIKGYGEEEDIDEPDEPGSPLLVAEDRRSFYLEHVAPLNAYMDESSPSGSLAHVVQFLTTCVQEGQLQQVIMLLRSIHNRSDDWSGVAYPEILSQVDASIQKQTGCRLDRTWLKL